MLSGRRINGENESIKGANGMFKYVVSYVFFIESSTQEMGAHSRMYIHVGIHCLCSIFLTYLQELRSTPHVHVGSIY